MGSNQSKRNNVTAERLWVVENAKKGIKAVGATLVSPFVVIACPIIGAYEYAYKDELGTGSFVVDGTLGFLFGVIASPLAPFFFMWERMEVLYGDPPPASPPSNEYLEDARQKMGLDSVTYYNVAITGCPGTGKSTLVNGLLGYTDDHISAAQVHEANNSVKESRGYKHPLLHSVMLWDMPGVTTSARQYFHEHCLGAFDAILIVFSDRLMATDIKLARKALEYDVPVFFIRNKADTALDSKIRKMADGSGSPAEKWARAVAELTEELNSNICNSLRNFGFGTEALYLISAWTLQDFVSALKGQKSMEQLRLIHEKLLIINLLAITEQRRKSIASSSDIIE